MRDRPAISFSERKMANRLKHISPKQIELLTSVPSWRKLNLAKLPDWPGIYAICHETQWLYIGQSVNIKSRLSSLRHPVNITKGLSSLNLSYKWHPWPYKSPSLRKIESFWIRKHCPEWNGGTSFDNFDAAGPACALLLPLLAWPLEDQAR